MSETAAPLRAEIAQQLSWVEGATWRTAASISGRAWFVTDTHHRIVAREATEAEVAAALVASEAQIAPRVVAAGERWLATEFVAGHHLTSVELRRPAVIDELAGLLRRWHRLDTETRRQAVSFRSVRTTTTVRSSLQAFAPTADAVEAALADAEAGQSEEHRVLCHLDVAANVLSTDAGLRLLDFEYAGYAPRSRELGQLTWEAEYDRGQMNRLVEAYVKARPDDPVQQNLLLEAVPTWAWLTGVTWSIWSADRPSLTTWSRRCEERLRTYWWQP